MIRPFLLAACAALALGVAAPGSARAQDAATQPAFVGLTPDSVRDWLVAAGAVAGDVTREGQDVFFRVDDRGVVWFVFFYGCETDGRCGDLQFNTVFDGTGVTGDTVNSWNREQRFLKAFVSDVDGAPVVFVQYDVLLHQGAPAAQLSDPVMIWIDGVAKFAAHVRARAGSST